MISYNSVRKHFLKLLSSTPLIAQYSDYSLPEHAVHTHVIKFRIPKVILVQLSPRTSNRTEVPDI